MFVLKRNVTRVEVPSEECSLVVSPAGDFSELNPVSLLLSCYADAFADFIAARTCRDSNDSRATRQKRFVVKFLNMGWRVLKVWESVHRLYRIKD